MGETLGNKGKVKQSAGQRPPLPDLMKLCRPALVGEKEKSNVVIGKIQKTGENTYTAPLILPPYENSSPLNPFADHVEGATMFRAVNQLFIGSRKKIHHDKRTEYIPMKSSQKIHDVLKPDEPATVVVSYGKPVIWYGNPIYEVSGKVLNSEGKPARTYQFLVMPRHVPRNPKIGKK